MSKKKIAFATAGVALVAAAGVAYLNGGFAPKTDSDVKERIDVQYDSLVTRLNSIPTNFDFFSDQQLDSLADVLASVKWQDIKDGGQLEQEKKTLYLNKKKGIAADMKAVYDQAGRLPVTLVVANPDAITE